MTKTVSVIYLTLLILTFFFISETHANIFSKNVDEIVLDALQSSNPKKVEKCLDKVINQNFQTGVLKIRRHARNMLRMQRADMVKANLLNKEQIEKKIIPWIKIDKKAIEFFKRKQVEVNGRDAPVSVYHQ